MLPWESEGGSFFWESERGGSFWESEGGGFAGLFKFSYLSPSSPSVSVVTHNPGKPCPASLELSPHAILCRTIGKRPEYVVAYHGLIVQISSRSPPTSGNSPASASPVLELQTGTTVISSMLSICNQGQWDLDLLLGSLDTWGRD